METREIETKIRNEIGDKTIENLIIIRDASSPRNHNIPYTSKCVYLNQVAKLLKMIAGSAPVIFVLAAIVWCMDNFYKTDMYSTNIYLQELEKSEKQDSEKRTNNHVCAQALCLHAGKPGRETQN